MGPRRRRGGEKGVVQTVPKPCTSHALDDNDNTTPTSIHV